MSNWIKQHQLIIFTSYVFLWAVLYVLFGTNIIHCNIKQYLFEHLPVWGTIIGMLIPILILFYLWPKK